MCFTVKVGQCADSEQLILTCKNTGDSRICNTVGGTGSVTTGLQHSFREISTDTAALNWLYKNHWNEREEVEHGDTNK